MPTFGWDREFSFSHETTLLLPDPVDWADCTDNLRAFSIAFLAEFMMATVDMGVPLEDNAGTSK